MGDMKKAVLATAVLFCTNVASAEPFTDQQLHELVKPAPGVATATLTGNPPWCDVVGKIAEPASPSSIYNESGGDDIIAAVHDVCANPTDPTWRRFAAALVQKQMNMTHQAQPDAEKSLRARVQTDKWTAQHDQLCKALAVAPEAAAEVKTFGDARLELFGCVQNGHLLWSTKAKGNPGGVGYYLDAAVAPDPLMRVYWLETFIPPIYEQKLPSTGASENSSLLYYAIAAPDLAKIDRNALDKILQAPPYNDYARVVMNETLADLANTSKFYETATDALAKGDEDYTTILRKAPQQAYADWDKLVAQWKPELEHSEAFEMLLSAPSRKAMKGCSTQLLKDGEKVVRQFKDANYREMIEKLEADPIANLLFDRLAVCTAFEGIGGISGALKKIVEDSRELRGARSLAGYAIVDAVTSAAKDRPRLVLTVQNFRPTGFRGERNLDDHDFNFHGSLAIESDRDRVVQGVVGSVTKTEEGMKITFKKVGFKFQNYTCSDTNKIARIADGGRIIYQQTCHNTPGTTSVDRTPDPVVIPTELAGVVKPGVFVSLEFSRGFGKSLVNTGAPMYTKKSPTDTKIASFYGLAM